MSVEQSPIQLRLFPAEAALCRRANRLPFFCGCVLKMAALPFKIMESAALRQAHFSRNYGDLQSVVRIKLDLKVRLSQQS
jgi:hypothetical protein